MLFLATTVWGQEQPESPQIVLPQSQPQALLPLKGFTYAFNSELSYDPNILRQQTSPLGSRLWIFASKLKYAIQAGGGTYSLGYDVGQSNFLDSKQDTVTNQALTLTIDQKINSYNRVMIAASYNLANEARGVGFNEGAAALALDKPTPLTTETVTAKYQLGADSAKMRFTGTVGYGSTDRNSQAIVNDSRDYVEDMLGAQLAYRVGARTDMVTEWRDRVVSYPRTPLTPEGSEIPLDSDEQLYLVGFDMEATAKTSAKLRVGTTQRAFKWKAAQWDDAKAASSNSAPVPATTTTNFPTDAGAELYWELSAVWAPRSYSKLELSTHSSTREGWGVGSFVLSKDYGLSWTHQWQRRLRTRLGFSVGSDVYKDSARVDNRKTYNMGMEYDFDDRMSFGFGYRYQQMKSTAVTVGFDKSIYYLFANYHNK